MSKSVLISESFSIFIIFIIIISWCNLCISCPHIQKEALLEFKSLLLGDNVTETVDLQVLGTWNKSIKCCEWDRVYCDYETNTHVTLLNFSYLIPSLGLTVVKADVLKPLFLLRTLEELNLGNNGIHGEIPAEIGNLTSLTWLSIFGNSFSGPIPLSMLKLNKLYHLDVSDNFLSMEIPSNIGNLSRIAYLSLGRNNFSGEIPSSIQNMQQLELLSLNDNSLYGNIPPWLFSFQHMKHLYLSYNLNLRFNNFSMAPRSMFEDLLLNSCLIAARIPTWIANQTDLKTLDLNNCDLTGMFPPQLAKLESLEALTLSGNSLSGTLPMSVFNMSKLKVLDLSCNRFSASKFPALSPHSPLLHLNLSYNLFYGHIPLPLAPKIEALVLNHNAFSGISLSQNATYWTRLKWLDLHHNNIAGEIPKFLSHFPSLQFLALRHNRFQGTIPDDLSKLKNLKVLDLSNNKLSGKIPSSLPCLKRKNDTAEALSVTFTTENLLFELGNFEVLWKRSKQNLHGNYIYMYGILDLSNNQLSDEIPDTLGRMEGLKSLNLSSNNLSGVIPRSIGNLQNLESLDLSHNELSGKIPDTFSKLLQLNNLDLSNNKLEGRIPEGPQMDRLNDPSWYANNSRLCGLQIQVSCTEPSPYVKARKPTHDRQESTWFSWMVAGIAYPFAFLSTVLYLYLTNFFRI